MLLLVAASREFVAHLDRVTEKLLLEYDVGVVMHVRRGREEEKVVQDRGPADAVEAVALLQQIGERDEVERLAEPAQFHEGRKNLAVGRNIERGSGDAALDYAVQHVGHDGDGAEHALLGVWILRKLAMEVRRVLHAPRRCLAFHWRLFALLLRWQRRRALGLGKVEGWFVPRRFRFTRRLRAIGRRRRFQPRASLARRPHFPAFQVEVVEPARHEREQIAARAGLTDLAVEPHAALQSGERDRDAALVVAEAGSVLNGVALRVEERREVFELVL